MSKHHRTAGTNFRTIKIEGQEYTIRPLTVGVYSEMEAYIVSKRGDPLAAASKAIENLPPNHHAAVWDAAMRQVVVGQLVTAEEASAFENSIQGLAWKLWKCLEADHPEIDSVETSLELLTKAGSQRLEEVARSVEAGSGEADLGNSSGREPTKTAADPAGQEYISKWEKSTDGDLAKSIS